MLSALRKAKKATKITDYVRKLDKQYHCEATSFDNAGCDFYPLATFEPTG